MNAKIPFSPRPQTKPIVVIGGGPAGSTCANLLAQAGHRVVLFEHARFPRFHVGESMLPHTQAYLDRLGAADLLENAKFRVIKKGGVGRLGKSPDGEDYWETRMDFWNVPDKIKHKERWWAYQVERAHFDQALLGRAQELGVQVMQPAKVTDVRFDGDPVVHWKDELGQQHELEACFVVDASGRRALLSRHLGHFREETQFMTSAVFGHFEGIEWPEGDEAGFINVYFIENGWVWFIPLPDGKTSVGIVQNESATKTWPRSPDQVLREIVGRYAYLRARFRGATQLGKVRILKRLPYFSKQIAGDNWALCGDAAMFVDPIHSSGMHLAFYSGTQLAEAVDSYLKGDRDAMARYQERVLRHHKYVRRNVAYYYRVVAHRPMIRQFVRLCGKWNNPFLRRVNAWGFGYYHRFRAAMYLWWGLAQAGIWGYDALHQLLGHSRWGRHGMQAPPRKFDLPVKAVSPGSSSPITSSPSPAEPATAL